MMNDVLKKLREIEKLISDIYVDNDYPDELQGKLSLMNVECMEAIKILHEKGIEG